MKSFEVDEILNYFIVLKCALFIQRFGLEQCFFVMYSCCTNFELAGISCSLLFARKNFVQTKIFQIITIQFQILNFSIVSFFFFVNYDFLWAHN